MNTFEKQVELHSKVFIFWFLNTDKLVKKTLSHLIFSTCLYVFRNQNENTYSCLNCYMTQNVFSAERNYSCSEFNFSDIFGEIIDKEVSTALEKTPIY